MQKVLKLVVLVFAVLTFSAVTVYGDAKSDALAAWATAFAEQDLALDAYLTEKARFTSVNSKIGADYNTYDTNKSSYSLKQQASLDILFAQAASDSLDCETQLNACVTYQYDGDAFMYQGHMHFNMGQYAAAEDKYWLSYAKYYAIWHGTGCPVYLAYLYLNGLDSLYTAIHAIIVAPEC